MSIHEIAIRLLDEYDNNKSESIWNGPNFKLSLADAYDVQFEIANMRQLRGEHIAGYKIGCISKTMQTQLGVDHPVFGHVWDTEIHRSGVGLGLGDFDCLAIEGEFAIRLRDDAPSSTWLQNNRDVLTEPSVAIELHNYKFKGSKSNIAAELISKNTIHAGIVIADDEIGLKPSKNKSMLSVYRNSICLGESIADHSQDGALSIVAALSEHLESRGLSLKKNQLILTGSPLPLWEVEAGDEISVLTDGLPKVTCTIKK